MLFASIGANKNKVVRSRALSTMFLFDNTVNKETVKKSREYLMTATPDCRTLTCGNVDALKTTAMSGVKSNRYFFAHSSNIQMFAQNGASNTSQWNGMYQVSTDGNTLDQQADRYVTIKFTAARGKISDKTSNIFGISPGVYDKAQPQSNLKMYYAPAAVVNNMRSTKNGIQIQPKFNNDATVVFYESGSNQYSNWYYQQYYSNAMFFPATNTYNTYNYNTIQIPNGTAYGSGNYATIFDANILNTTVGAMMMLTAEQSFTTFPVGGGYSSTNYSEGYMSRAVTSGLHIDEPLSVQVTGMSDNDCVLAFGAIAIETYRGYDLLLLDVAQDDSSDLKQVGTTVAQQADLIASDAVKAMLTAPSVFSV